MKKIIILLALTINTAHATPTYSVDYYDNEDEIKIATMCNQLATKNNFKSLEKFLRENDNETSKDKNGLAIAVDCVNGIVKNANIIQIWKNQFPKSVYPILVEKGNLARRFFELRGTETIANTPPEQYEKAIEFLENGAHELDNSRKLGTTPLWYSVRIEAAFYQPDKRYFFYYLQEAINKYPNYLPIYSVAAENMLPQWGYSYEDLDNFARLGMTKSTLKETVYTSIYKSVVTPCCANKISSAGYFSQETFRKGMNAILARYPTQRNYNRYAQFSCLLGDVDSARRIYKEKMTVHIRSLWFKGVYESCLDKMNATN